jgi:DNA-binding CsgD family transcriptional regulator
VPAYLSDVVRFTTFLTLHPKPIDLLAALSRDFLHAYGVLSVQLFSLHKNNVLELQAETGKPGHFKAVQISQPKLEELEELLSTENICKEIALKGCVCDPDSGLTVTPFSVGTQLRGFFLVEWPKGQEISEEAMEAVSLFSALSSLYFAHSKFFPQEIEKIAKIDGSGGQLSARQIQILEGIVEGKTNHEMATDLGFSVSTIRHETMRIFRALGVSDRKEAATVATLMETLHY